MMNRITIQGFKSLAKVELSNLPRLAVLFGPNTSGKSNFLDAVLALSRIGTSRTLVDALQEPIRGYPIECFAFPAGGLPELLNQESATFSLATTLAIGKELYDYSVAIRISPAGGALTIEDEYLALLTTRGSTKGNPLIEKVENELRIRRKSKPSHPRTELVGLTHSLLSDLRLGGVEYGGVERCRDELHGWRMYYLDPRNSMRRSVPPSQVEDIGPLGENIAPYLYRLRKDAPKSFDAVNRLLRTLIPTIEGLEVDLDKKRGTLDIMIRQHGIDYSSRIISEGTLRVLALCAIAVNPQPAPLLAFEEPENGVHPRRLDLIADFLATLTLDRQCQLLITTHSPRFCAVMAKKAASNPGDIGLFRVVRRQGTTQIEAFDVAGELFEDIEISRALSNHGEDGIFEGLTLRGMLDE